MKRWIAIGSVTLCLATALVIRSCEQVPTDPSDQTAAVHEGTQPSPKLREPSPKFIASEKRPKTKARTTTKTSSPLWPHLAALSDEEAAEFELVETEIRRFIQWGAMQPNSVETFRGLIWRLGDRAIADTARKLASLNASQVTTAEEAEHAVDMIDLIAYFAAIKRPVATEAVAYLARRRVKWQATGELVDPLAATVTFEAFDLLAKNDPDQAAAHIHRMSQNKGAFVLHYIYGRKMAGLSGEDVRQEVLRRFGPEFVRGAS